MATSFFYIYVMATSFFYIYIYIYNNCIIISFELGDLLCMKFIALFLVLGGCWLLGGHDVSSVVPRQPDDMSSRHIQDGGLGMSSLY